MKDFLNKYLKYLILAALLYFPLFGHLDSLPIRIWDESRQAVNAYEMLHNGNFVVTYFDGKPDMWNTKPPMLIWLQVFWMKILGVGELAVRLPSAIAALFTCVALMLLSLRYLKNFWFGFIAVFVLITTYGYVHFHATRTGDYDALLTMFTTIGGLCFFAYCENTNKNFLYGFFICMTFAVLTKSVAGLIFIPAFFLYGLIRKQIIPLLKNKHFYFGLALFLGVVAGYYLLRDLLNPGYFAAVNENELGGRYGQVIEEHQHAFRYYFDNLLNFRLTEWYLLIPCGLLTGFASKDEKIRRITLFSSLMVGIFFLVISTSKTKLEWYDVPLYPYFAILIAVFIHFVFQLLNNLEWINKNLSPNVAPWIFIFFLGLAPYIKIFNKTHVPREAKSDVHFYEIEYYLRGATVGKHDVNGTYLVYDGNYAQNLFYVYILNDQGIKISMKDKKNLTSGDVVIVSQRDAQKYIEEKYTVEITSANGSIIRYKIHGTKQS